MIDFKPISGFPNYAINAEGVVVNLRRNRPVKPKTKRSGHLEIKLFDHGKRHHKLLHRLLMETFVCEQPFNKPFVCHRNGNPSDNRLSNLYWGTPQDNSNDRVRHGRSNKGESNPCAVLTEDQAIHALDLFHNGMSRKEIALLLGVSKSAIKKLVAGETWKHLPRKAYMKKSNKDVNAQAQGKKGGLRGGPARAKKLTPTERSEIARKGAQAKNSKYGK